MPKASLASSAGLTTFGARPRCYRARHRDRGGSPLLSVRRAPGPRPGARLVPERSLTTPIHGGRDRRRAIKASTGFGQSDLECLVSRGKRERSAGILREVGIETGASIGRGETAEIQTCDVDPLVDATLVGCGVEPQTRSPAAIKRAIHQQHLGQQACDLLRGRR